VEELAVGLLWLVAEFAGEMLLELLFEIGLAGLMSARARKRRGPVAAVLGYLVLGALLGALWVWLLPARIVGARAVPGASLVLGPLAAGVVMETWGRYRRAGGHATTNLATWYGGAAFALGIAVVRFFGVR
jgi:hypothetical protein